ncbi:protein possibly processed from cytochrome c import factor, partial [Scheffersomyces stipitis CBS 6054]
MLVFRATTKRVRLTSVLSGNGLVNFQRLKSSESGKGGDFSDEKKTQNQNEKANENNDLISQDNRDVSQFKIRSASSRSAPAPIDAQDTGLDRLVKRNNKPYIPKLKHDRVSFEYPGLPNEDDFAKAQQPKTTTRWSRYVPKILTALAVVWGAYTVKVWIYAPENGADSKELLDPSEFHKFIVTHKEEIDDDHYLIELLPKHSKWQYSYNLNYESKSIWNGDRIWSVDVKQPDIMVVRAYTPLPLYFLKSEYTRSGERKPLLKVINN